MCGGTRLIAKLETNQIWKFSHLKTLENERERIGIELIDK